MGEALAPTLAFHSLTIGTQGSVMIQAPIFRVRGFGSAARGLYVCERWLSSQSTARKPIDLRGTVSSKVALEPIQSR